MPVVIEQRVELTGSPGVVFGYLTDPTRRPEWDAACLRCELQDADRVAAGVRVRITGRGMAPSWLGEYDDYRPARSAGIRLVEGQGMPFRSYAETVRVEVRKGGCTVTLRHQYEVSGLARLIEPLTVRSKLRRVSRRSAENLRKQFP